MSAMPQTKRMIWNIRPTDIAAVLAPNKQGDIAVFSLIWGFTHEAASQLIVNCRIETADQKAIWKDSWFRRRCIIPASWYFELGIPPSEVGFHNDNEQHSIKKEKYAIQPEGTEITYLAGLYRFEEHRGVQVPMFAVLTRESVAPVRAIHERMPLILGKEDLKDWIRPGSDPASISKRALTNMIVEKAGNYPDPIEFQLSLYNRREPVDRTPQIGVSGHKKHLLSGGQIVQHNVWTKRNIQWHDGRRCIGKLLPYFFQVIIIRLGFNAVLQTPLPYSQPACLLRLYLR